MADIDIYKVITHYMGEPVAGKVVCPFHNDGSPSLHIYEESHSAYCYAAGCNWSGDAINFVQDYHKVTTGQDLPFKDTLERVTEVIGEDANKYVGKDAIKAPRPIRPEEWPLPPSVIRDFYRGKVIQNVGYRGIREETDKFFNHFSDVNDQGEVTARYYPETRMFEGEDGETSRLFGVKCRNHPKDFSHGKIGITGNKNQFSGQNKFTGRGKYILIVGGEEDKCAAYQMYADNYKLPINPKVSKDNTYNTLPVISPTAGEGSVVAQAKANYDFLDGYENIMIGLDNDDAGRKAAEALAQVLPKEKVRIISWSGGDPNQMLLDGKIKQFVSDFHAAKEYVKTEVKSSLDIMDGMKEYLTAQKISLPPYMTVLEKNMKRAFNTNGCIVNIIGETSHGKTTHVDNAIYHWIMEEGIKPLVMSLEDTAVAYAAKMLSLHLQKNLDWFEDGMDAWNYLNKPEVKELYQNLFKDEHGEERFKIIDDRAGNIDSLQKTIEASTVKYGCNLVVIDVLSDLIRFYPNDKQEAHMNWQKNFVKDGVSIVNTCHTRKIDAGKDGKFRKPTEYDILGSSTIPQSAHINIVIWRNKMAEDPIEKNTTYVYMPKCRRGITGEAGAWYFDGETRQCYDSEQFFSGDVERKLPIVNNTKELITEENSIAETDKPTSTVNF